jgi:hypothetical protein
MEFEVEKVASSPGIVFHQHLLTQRIKFYIIPYRKYAREGGGFQPAREVLKNKHLSQSGAIVSYGDWPICCELRHLRSCAGGSKMSTKSTSPCQK